MIDILIIDDDQVNNFVLKNIVLRSYPNANIQIQREGVSALRYLKELRDSGQPIPGVILLDINMPLMNGFEFLDVYHREFATESSYIYMVSSSISKSDQQRANGYEHVHGFITKPLVNQNIVFMVEEYLYSRS